jgi:hypothetical protein
MNIPLCTLPLLGSVSSLPAPTVTLSRSFHRKDLAQCMVSIKILIDKPAD